MDKLIILLVILALIIGCASTTKHKKFDAEVKSDIIMKDRDPEKLNEPKPVYPKLALMSGYEAVVWVQSTIDSTGQVIKAEIIKVNGKENVGFEESALEAAYATKWKPLIKDGKPTETIVAYKITYWQ